AEHHRAQLAAGKAARGGGGQLRHAAELEPVAGAAELVDHAEAGLARKVREDRALRETRHEEARASGAPRLQRGDAEQRVAVAAAAAAGRDGKVEARGAAVRVEREVRDAGQVAALLDHAEDAVADEVEAGDVAHDGAVAERHAEAQRALLGREMAE